MPDNFHFRPWGLLDDLLPRDDPKNWSIIGCVSTEDRCIAAYEKLSTDGKIFNSIFFKISDRPSRYEPIVNEKISKNINLLTDLGLAEDDIHSYDIVGREGDYISKMDQYLNENVGPNLIIDITSLPKKYFFILIKKALSLGREYENIFGIYTQPKKYSGQKLSENHGTWSELPGFMAPRKEPETKKLIIGLGFEPLGLPAMYGTGLFNKSEQRYLFPFPASPQSVDRNWDFIRTLRPKNNFMEKLHTVDGLSVPTIFDTLGKLTDDGRTYSILAPFGPKTMSLAMCLFACAHKAKDTPPSVFYTQPTVYNPNYTSGVRDVLGKKCIYAYALRLNGRNLY